MLSLLRVPDQKLGGQGHTWCHKWSCLTLRKIPLKFCVIIFIRSVSGVGGHEWGYLEDAEGSWSETWRAGSFLTSWIMFFYPKEDTLKISCWYLNWKCVRKGGSRRGVLGGCWGVPDRRLGGQGHPWCHGWPCLTTRKILWKFYVDIFIRSVSSRGGPSWGYQICAHSQWKRIDSIVGSLEDSGGSWFESHALW